MHCNYVQSFLQALRAHWLLRLKRILNCTSASPNEFERVIHPAQDMAWDPRSDRLLGKRTLGGTLPK